MRRISFVMGIQLSKDHERFVRDAVRAGFYASEDAVVSAALTKLKETLPKNTKPRAKKARSPRAGPRKPRKPLTIQEIHQQMLASGLITSLPDPARDVDDDDPDDAPVIIKGEPLSETIIRERR
jgi:Arc/MetJ-type ribon-helix-helix transcriptional regulator